MAIRIPLLVFGFLLIAASAAAQEKTITLKNGHNIWTKRVGNGTKKILFLHGGPGHSSAPMIAPFENAFSGTDYEVWFYDQLGSGKSDRPTDTSLYNLPRFLNELEEVTVQLGLNSFYLIGHSWGGILAMEYSLLHPERVKALVVSNMCGSISDLAMHMDSLRNSFFLRDSLDASDESSETLFQSYLFTNYVSRLPLSETPVLADEMQHMNLLVNATMLGPGGNLIGWNIYNRLPRLRPPTLFIGSPHDYVPMEKIKRAADLAPNGEFYAYPRGGHLGMIDDSREYFFILLPYLDRH